MRNHHCYRLTRLRRVGLPIYLPVSSRCVGLPRWRVLLTRRNETSSAEQQAHRHQAQNTTPPWPHLKNTLEPPSPQLQASLHGTQRASSRGSSNSCPSVSVIALTLLDGAAPRPNSVSNTRISSSIHTTTSGAPGRACIQRQ